MESAMQSVEESIQDYMKTNKGLTNGNAFDTTSR